MTRPRRGFTLLEVLAASALFFIAVAGVFSSFNVAARLTRHFELETVALHVIDGFLEELVLRPRDSADLAPGPHPTGVLRFGNDGEPNAAGAFRLTWNVVDGSPAPGLRSITAVVDWLEGPTPHTITMTTVRE